MAGLLAALLAAATGSGPGNVVMGWAARALLRCLLRHRAGPGGDGIGSRAAVRTAKCELSCAARRRHRAVPATVVAAHWRGADRTERCSSKTPRIDATFRCLKFLAARLL
jgi:hypothetical protein